MSPFPGEDRPVELSIWGLSDVGQARSENQDAFLIAELPDEGSDGGFLLGPDSPEPSDGAQPNIRLGRRGALLLVADGMGGAAGGQVASRLAVSALTESLVQGWGGDRLKTPERFAHHLEEAVREANHKVFERSRVRPELAGMGTTATAAGILDDFVYLAQVGDSRAYLVRGDRIVQLTRDQSMVQELMDQGAMTQAEAEASIHRSVLLQALGTEPQVNVALTYHPLRRGDRLLLCSDGLSGPVNDAEIGTIVARAANPRSACSELVALANERGGPDNITVILGHLHGEGLQAPSDGDQLRRRPFQSDAV